jgi:hypothetical protein
MLILIDFYSLTSKQNNFSRLIFPSKQGHFSAQAYLNPSYIKSALEKMSSSSSSNPLLLAAQSLLAHSKSSSSSSSSSFSSSSAMIDSTIPPQLIDRFASHSRIRSIAKVFDKDAELEDGAVEVIDKLLTYFVEDWTQMASEVALARTDPSADCGVGGVSSGGPYSIGPSASSLSGQPILTVNDFHAYISSAAYPYIVLPTDEIASHLSKKGPPANASIEPAMHKLKIAELPAEREIASINTVTAKADAMQTISAVSGASSNVSGKEKEKTVTFSSQSQSATDGGGGGGKRKREASTTINESGSKVAEEKKLKIESRESEVAVNVKPLPQPTMSTTAQVPQVPVPGHKLTFKFKAPASSAPS